MNKLFGTLLVGALLIFAASNIRSISKVALAYTPASLAGGSASHSAETATKPAAVQEQEGSKHCERPNPNNPDVGNKDPNKTGCTCRRKCVGGKPAENYEEGTPECKSHCKPDQCDCPNPCKT